jgi:geranylgeranyl pyrophosphate synthase
LILTGGAFDLHDDIIDGSYSRKKNRKKTIMGYFGREATLLGGDALLIAGMSELFDLQDLIPKERFTEVLAVIKDGLFELGSAEMDEMSLIRNFDATPRAYLRIVQMKAADVESYLKVGGIIGGGSTKEVDTLGRFGRLLGMITILRDDIEDTFYDREELSSRITRESLPLPLVYSLKDPDFRKKLESCSESVSRSDLEEILSLVEKNEGFAKTKDVVEGYVKEAKKTALQLSNPQMLLALFEN